MPCGVYFIFCLLCLTVSGRSPNVVIIYTDDQGSVDMGSYGAADLATPHMDALAASGVRFTQFYGAPVCTPSRVSLLTGQTPQRAGVTGNVPATPDQAKGLYSNSYTMVDLFKGAGYQTAHIGKWHLGYARDAQPLAHGFDLSFGHLVGCIDNYSHYYYWRGPNRHDLYRNGVEVFHEGEFFPELMLEEAKAFINAVGREPFFLYFAMNTPHYPYQGYAEWLEYYNQKGVAYPRNLYGAFLSTQDDIIGKLIEHLEVGGLIEDTIIILQSDNGHSTEERAHCGGGSAGPFRGAKASLFEGGIRVPSIISWPSVLPQGVVRGQMAVNTDWLPTLAELCDLRLGEVALDGRSLVGVIHNAASSSPHEEGYCWQFRDQWAVRMGAWKLLGNAVDTGVAERVRLSEKLLLVNLETDPGEAVNLAAKYPERVEAMHRYYKRWSAQYD